MKLNFKTFSEKKNLKTIINFGAMPLGNGFLNLKIKKTKNIHLI